MFIRSTTWRITSMGHGEPAMIPVRSDDRSKSARSGSPNSAMNIVGTPYKLVQRSWATVLSVALGLNQAAGITMAEPWVVQARLPSTIPKQW